VLSREGSTARLIQLCVGYFVFYVITGVAVKYFLGSPQEGLPGMSGVTYLVYSTIGGTAIALGVVLIFRWYRLRSPNRVRIGPFDIPLEALYIIPSGVCTAVIIPTTTLMYTLPISVMVAMVIMRGSVIVISRAVDAIQIRQGLLKKRVYADENIAVVFALAAIAVNVLSGRKGGFEFLSSPPAMMILGSYVIAYAIRIYIMNYYKNTRPPGSHHNNQAFFAIEQITASLTLLLTGIILFRSPDLMGASGAVIEDYRGAFTDPHAAWGPATISGMAFGAVSFFSVFLFMFKGRTATFAGLVNRLTSLIAGTAATLIFAVVWGGRFPRLLDWGALGLILAAIFFLARSERRRRQELEAEQAV
jgi:hypothetical protein